MVAIQGSTSIATRVFWVLYVVLYYHEIDFDAIGGVLYCHKSYLVAICSSLYYHEVDYDAIGGGLYCHAAGMVVIGGTFYYHQNEFSVAKNGVAAIVL